MLISGLRKQSKLSAIDTRLLVCHVLNWSHAKFISEANYYILTDEEYKLYNSLYKQCLEGKPLSYILGYKEFYSRSFKVTPATLIPRPETEILVDLALKVSDVNSRVLELGTGTGCIAISLKLEKPLLNVDAIDISLDALAIAVENAKKLCAKVNLYQSDWFNNVTGKFDVIISNPPYIEHNDSHLNNLQYEPKIALTDFADGLSCLEHIIAQSVLYLNKGGYLLLEHGYNQGSAVRQMIRANALFTGVETICDYAGLERVTLARRLR